MVVAVKVVAIDPGYKRSAVVVLEHGAPIYALLEENDFVLSWLSSAEQRGPLVIEQIESMGMSVGKEVFETVFWSGRFADRWSGRGLPFDRVTRRTVKLHLCGTSRAKDPNVRQALIDRFGPGKEAAIGLKKSPGPLYGFKSDLWAALAVAVTWVDQHNLPDNVTAIGARRTS